MINASIHFLDRHIEQGNGNRPAIVFEGETYTYHDLFYATCQAANLFAEAGLKAGDRVQIILPDSPLFIACFFGLIRIGAIPSPISSRFADQDYLKILSDCQPRAVVTSDEHLSIISEL